MQINNFGPQNLIVNKSIEFSIQIVQYCEQLEREKKFVIANQLLRSGTSIGANVWEAQNAESISDFIHKFKIAAKEASETLYWLTICRNVMACPEIDKLLDLVIELHKILNRIIASSKKRANEVK